MGVAPYLCLLLSCLAGVRSGVVLTQPASAVVKPGQSHRLTCQVSGFDLGSYGMSWVKQVSGNELKWLAVVWGGGSTKYAPGIQGRFEVSKDSGAVYLHMNDLRPDDTATYYCTRTLSQVAATLDYWGKGTSLTVTSVAKSLPSVYITPSCNMESGQEISLLCLVKGYMPESISQTWSINGGDITTGIKKYPAVFGQSSLYTMSSLLQVPAADFNRNEVYFCKAGYEPSEMVTERWSSERPVPKLIPLVPSPDFIHNQTTAVLGCLISGVPPDNLTVSWKKAGSARKGIVLPSTTTDGGFETVTYLRVPVQEWISEQEYTCEVTDTSSGFRQKVNMRYQDELSVFVQNPSTEEIWINKTATLVCRVVGADLSQVQIYWQVSEREKIKGNVTKKLREEGTQDTVISQLQTSVEEWSSGVEYVCSAQQTSSSSAVTARTKSTKVETKRPKVRLLPPPHEGTKSRNTATLECVVSGFYPDLISVSWEEGSSVITSNTSATPTALEQGGTFSVSYFLTVSLQEWKSDSVFSCTVTHPPSGTRIKKQVKNIQEVCTDLTGEEGKEEPGDLDGVDNVLAVAAFAILFVISFLYSTFVTVVKVLQ